MDHRSGCHDCQTKNIDTLTSAGCVYLACPKQIMMQCPACKMTPADNCYRLCRGENNTSQECMDCRVSATNCKACYDGKKSSLFGVCATFEMSELF